MQLCTQIFSRVYYSCIMCEMNILFSCKIQRLCSVCLHQSVHSNPMFSNLMSLEFSRMIHLMISHRLQHNINNFRLQHNIYKIRLQHNINKFRLHVMFFATIYFSSSSKSNIRKGPKMDP